jgi:DNA-binding YbaB/EbfC family protein
MNQQQMMQQIKKMQAEMEKAQDEIANTVVSGTAAGGLVTVEMSAGLELRAVKIKPEAVDPEDVETLEDLVTVAFNDAIAKAQTFASTRMASVTGGMKIPGLM